MSDSESETLIPSGGERERVVSSRTRVLIVVGATMVLRVCLYGEVSSVKEEESRMGLEGDLIAVRRLMYIFSCSLSETSFTVCD